MDERLPKDQPRNWSGGLVGWLVSVFVNILCVFFFEFLKEKHPPIIYVGLIYIQNGFHFSTLIFFGGLRTSTPSQRTSPWQRVAGKMMMFLMSLEWDMYPFPGRYFMVILC